MSVHTASLRGATAAQNRLGPPYPLRKRRGYVLHLTVICSLIVFLTLVYVTLLVFLPDFPVALPFQSGPSKPGWDDRPPDIFSNPYVSRPYLLRPSSPLGSHAIALLDDPTHVLIPAAPLAAPIRLLESIHDRLPRSLLSQFYAIGTLSSSAKSLSIQAQPPIDLVYLYVNASSPYFQEALGERAGSEGIKTIRGKARRWRDNGELRGAIRSGVKALGDSLGRVHVISADFNRSIEEEFDIDVGEDLTEKEDEATSYDGYPLESMSNATGDVIDATDIDLEIEEWRIGQIPAWINWAGTSSQRIAWHFHSWVYRLPRDNDGSIPPALREGAWADEEEWRRFALPSFDSFGIETRIGWIEGLSENLWVLFIRDKVELI